MKNQRIIRAYDSINPSPAEKQQMLDAILAEASLSEKHVKQKKARKEPIVYTAKPTKSSRRSTIGAIAASFIMLVIAGVILASMVRNQEVDPAYVEPTTEITEATESVETVPEFPDSVYKDTLEKYYRAMDQGWNRTMCTANSMSMLTPVESE